VALLNEPTQIADVTLSNVLMNGAYSESKTYGDCKKLILASCGAVVIGSISVKARQPNSGQKYWQHKEGFFSLNSYGMPNGGISYFKQYLPKMVELAHSKGKPLIANIVGFSKEEFGLLIKFAEEAGADLVELNFGCPNVWNEGKQKQIISYHPAIVRSMLSYIATQKPQVKIAVKISPLPPDTLAEVSNVIARSGIVQAITATNSYPNASITYGSRGKQISDEILTGFSGRALKPISLGVVSQLHKLLPNDIGIIGCGGISSINDVNDYLTAGAKAVQIVTALKQEGLSVFDNLLQSASNKH
jgi:dihydroorotate dehydrogenase